jgi:ribulose-phosphate 3-epimerase
MSDTTIKIAPSILSADFSRLGDQVREATVAGANYIHLDVMDGQYVPNITFGPVVIENLNEYTNLPLDAHLMVADPDRHVSNFIKAGVNHITVHVEAAKHLHNVIYEIKQAGLKAGVALNPSTPISAIEEILPFIDIALILTVNPGFSGQTLILSALKKATKLKNIIQEKGYTVAIEVDGGVNPETAGLVARSGADIVVAGSAIFNKQISISQAMNNLRAKLSEAFN